MKTNGYKKSAMIKDKGITLIELLAVISIVGILVIVLGLSYRGWQAGYRVESTIKQIYSDMMDARVRAMTRNIAYFADFPGGAPPQVYSIFEDTDGNLTPGAGGGDNVLQSFPKTIQYILSRTATWVPANAVMFETRGTMQTPSGLGDTLCIRDVENPELVGVVRDYDCIIIAQTRINMGLLAAPAGACNAANCQAR